MSHGEYYKLILQDDGNLELLCIEDNNKKIWETNTKGKNIDALYFVKGGMALYETDKTVAWTAGTWRKDTGPEKLVLQDDGNFVMYDKNGNVLWSSGTMGNCATGMSKMANILCYPNLQR